MTPRTIAVLQAAARDGDVAANLATVRAAADEAAAQGATVLVAPETFTTGYALDRVGDLAEPLDGPAVAELRRIASDARIAVVCGIAERAGEQIHNTAVLVGEDGQLRAAYRKTHLFGAAERAAFVPGDALTPPAQAGGLRVGLLVCNDLEFPETARALALQGAELIAVPTALPAVSAWIPETLVPARAGENQLHVAYANHAGDAFAGRSTVAGPGGRHVRAGATDEGVLVAELDLGVAAAARARQDYLAERRPELYRRLRA